LKINYFVIDSEYSGPDLGLATARPERGSTSFVGTNLKRDYIWGYADNKGRIPLIYTKDKFTFIFVFNSRLLTINKGTIACLQRRMST
jgi:hypothetical protein